VTYIDHHPISSSTKKKLKKIGITIIHSIRECASVLSYNNFKNQLHEDMKLLAIYGAITDYRDSGPIAHDLIQRYDRQFILFEASMLSYALERYVKDESYLNELIKELAFPKHPHQIEGVVKDAVFQAEKMAKFMRIIKIKGKKKRNFAYIDTKETTSGNVANFLIGIFKVPVGVAYKISPDNNIMEISLRGSYNSKYNLGKISSKIAKKFDGSGGGHSKAAGLRIPATKKLNFLEYLDNELENNKLKKY
jgi:RecJ-like exonuclease